MRPPTRRSNHSIDCAHTQFSLGLREKAEVFVARELDGHRVNLGIQVNLGFTYYPSIFFSFSSFVSSSSFLKKKTIVNLIEEFVVISN